MAERVESESGGEFPFWSVIELDATPLHGWTP